MVILWGGGGSHERDTPVPGPASRREDLQMAPAPMPPAVSASARDGGWLYAALSERAKEVALCAPYFARPIAMYCRPAYVRVVVRHAYCDCMMFCRFSAGSFRVVVRTVGWYQKKKREEVHVSVVKCFNLCSNIGDSRTAGSFSFWGPFQIFLHARGPFQ